MSRLVVVALLVLSCVALGSAIRCYTCSGTGDTNPRCWSAETSPVVEYDESFASCEKTTRLVGENVHLIRRGSQVKRAEGCYYISGGRTCYCHSDLCNGDS
ncbi:hypothetical protein BV898_01963 [Hypsibius exemplaris]|uniref:Protein sleepless n=1 Tax=Hypsibius exemplaris TaxID=2072580 RepID=A0A1W0X8Y6_HYPEX|nr:hypothetical protein BV898_01963 [Hypsibius exemplaris]